MPLDTRDLRIVSPRLSIEPFQARDADESFACLTPTLTRFMSWEPPASPAAYAQVWEQWLPSIADGSDIVFAIRQREDARFIGLVGLHDIDSETPELGIWIREDLHGQGLGRESVETVLHWSSARIRGSHFIYPVAMENLASRRIAEALGGIVIETRTAEKYNSVVYGIAKV